MLGDNNSLKKLFEAAPGCFSSKLVKRVETDFPVEILARFWGVMDGFMNHISSSNSVIESVKTRRAIICMYIVSTISYPFSSQYGTLSNILTEHRYPSKGYRLWHGTITNMLLCCFIVAQPSHGHDDPFPNFFSALTSRLMPFWMLQCFRRQ